MAIAATRTTSAADPERGDAAPSTTAGDVWFGPLWAMAVLWHLAANDAHLLRLDLIGFLQLVMVGLAVAMVVRPSWRVAGSLAALSSVVLWMKLPYVGNHEIVLGLLHLAIVVAVVRARAGWTAAVAPAARWILLVAYGSIALSKLNSDFFDPAVSCAVVFGDEFGRWVGATVPTDGWAATTLTVATAAVESVIPLLLVLPGGRGRRLGVPLALGFHFLLAVEPTGHVWDFSSALFPLFLLFAPAVTRRRLDRLWSVVSARPESERALTLVVMVIGHAAVAWGPGPSWLVAYPAWLVVGGTVLAVATRAMFIGRSSSSAVGLAIGPAMAMIVILAVVNGASPYLGWRSAAAFNMYANLQVFDGASNHLLIPAALDRTDRPVVRIVDAPDGHPLQYYRGTELAVPVENLVGFGAEHSIEDVIVEVDGAPRPATTLTLEEPPSSGVRGLIERKLGFRRAVDTAGPVDCLRAWGPAG